MADKDVVILLQNAFSTLEKYIDDVHRIDGVPFQVPSELQKEVKSMFKNIMGLKKRGINLFFTDIDMIKEKMIEELNK